MKGNYNLGWKQPQHSLAVVAIEKYQDYRLRDTVAMVVMIIFTLLIGSLAQ